MAELISVIVAGVNAAVPFPFNNPFKVDAPVPPFVTFSVPPKVIAPVVAEAGVNPVLPPDSVVTADVDVK